MTKTLESWDALEALSAAHAEAAREAYGRTGEIEPLLRRGRAVRGLYVAWFLRRLVRGLDRAPGEAAAALPPLDPPSESPVPR